MSEPARGLVLRGLTKEYPGPVAALTDFELATRDRELVAVLGPSGSGKSTLLRLVAGLEPPSRGQVLLDGTALDGRPPRDRGVAIVFQGHSLFPHLSAFDNVAFGLRLRGTSEAEVRTRVTEAARGLGIEPLLARMPEALSGGERQRVALARALVRRPRVFLLDEPLAGVDPNQRAALRGEIRRLHRELGAITLMVTHDQVEALTLADRVVVLREGRLQQAETPDRLYVRPANLFVAGFVGTPPMNQLEGEVQTAPGGAAVFVHGTLRLAVPGRYAATLGGRPVHAVTAGLRPEHVRVQAAAPYQGSGLRARIEHIETWGPLRFAWVRLGDVSIVGMVAAGLPLDPGGEVQVDLETEEMHLFDTATGQALATDAPQGKDAPQ